MNDQPATHQSCPVEVPDHPLDGSFPSSYAVEDGKTGERGPGPAATTLQATSSR